MYVYIESSEIGKMFVYADKEQGQMIQLSQEEFTKRFECYEKDLEKSDGIRPWENKGQSKEKMICLRALEQLLQGRMKDEFYKKVF